MNFILNFKSSGFSTFDQYHLIWLLMFIAVGILMYKHFITLTINSRLLLLKFMAWTILVLEIIKDLLLLIFNQFVITELPLHLCGISIFLCLYEAYKQSTFSKELIYSLSLPGALLAILFPNWTNIAPFGLRSSQAFIIHFLIVMFSFLMMSNKDFRPNIKNAYKILLFLIFISIPIHFFNVNFNTNFMFIESYSANSPLVYVAMIFPKIKYYFKMILLMMLWLFLMYFPWYTTKK